MNAPDPRPGDASGDLLRATELLRRHTDSGWQAMRSTVLERALSAFRPSAPVRGRHDLGEYVVAADVLVDQLREALTVLPGVVPDRILCATDETDALEAVTVEVVAGYGHDLLHLADGVREVVADRLDVLLGHLAPDLERITANVHVSDVSDDPADRA